jgi:hypothetical protein
MYRPLCGGRIVCVPVACTVRGSRLTRSVPWLARRFSGGRVQRRAARRDPRRRVRLGRARSGDRVSRASSGRLCRLCAQIKHRGACGRHQRRVSLKSLVPTLCLSLIRFRAADDPALAHYHMGISYLSLRLPCRLSPCLVRAASRPFVSVSATVRRLTSDPWLARRQQPRNRRWSVPSGCNGTCAQRLIRRLLYPGQATISDGEGGAFQAAEYGAQVFRGESVT